MGMLFLTIDGNYSKPENICAYCTHYGACLTKNLMRTHNCRCNKKNEECKSLFYIEHKNEYIRETDLVGDAYRQSLQRKKH